MKRKGGKGGRGGKGRGIRNKNGRWFYKYLVQFSLTKIDINNKYTFFLLSKAMQCNAVKYKINQQSSFIAILKMSTRKLKINNGQESSYKSFTVQGHEESEIKNNDK